MNHIRFRPAKQQNLDTSAISAIITLQEATVIPYDGVDSKFRLVIIASRRAKQLIAGSKKRVEIKAENPLTVALQEIKEKKINFEIMKEEEANLLREDSQKVEEEVAKVETENDEINL